MIEVSQERDLTAIGQLCGQLQLSIRTIETLIVELKLTGLSRVNGVLFLNGRHVERIISELRKRPQAPTRPQAATRRRFQ